MYRNNINQIKNYRKAANIMQKPSTGKKSAKVEDVYQKKTQIEHVLLRPDTYVGSVDTV